MDDWDDDWEDGEPPPAFHHGALLLLSAIGLVVWIFAIIGLKSCMAGGVLWIHSQWRSHWQGTPTTWMR